jgi:hypothetical protein
VAARAPADGASVAATTEDVLARLREVHPTQAWPGGVRQLALAVDWALRRSLEPG